MTWERVEQLIGTNNLQKLAEIKVGIIGLGSGGGFVAQSLAMSGIGNFILIDDDMLEMGNIVRHIADSRYVGKPKVEAVAELIQQRNPKANIETHVSRIEDVIDTLESMDILVVGVDHENVKYIINEACLKHNLTAVYAGVYERGEGGDVVMIRPYEGPCYACWASELRDGLSFAETEGELDYGMIGQEGTLEAEPGLWLHVVKVASIQSDLILNELLYGTAVSEKMPGNTIIIANNSLEIIEGQITPPHTGVWVNIGRDPNCLVCGDKVRMQQQSATQDIALDDVDESMIVFEEESEQKQQRQ